MSHKLLLAYISKLDKSFLENKTIIEIGCTREIATKKDGTIYTWYQSST
jgi:hypothetical protein